MCVFKVRLFLPLLDRDGNYRKKHSTVDKYAVFCVGLV